MALRAPPGVTRVDPEIAQIYADFEQVVTSLRIRMDKQLEEMQAAQKQLLAEKVKEEKIKERLTLLNLERDALLIDINELRAQRRGVNTANEERASALQTIHESLGKIATCAGPQAVASMRRVN